MDIIEFMENNYADLVERFFEQNPTIEEDFNDFCLQEWTERGI